MKVEIKNSDYKPNSTKTLFDYFQSIKQTTFWIYQGLKVEIDPTFDFKGDDVLIRWSDIEEGFNDKLIVNSLQQFNSLFLPLTNA